MSSAPSCAEPGGASSATTRVAPSVNPTGVSPAPPGLRAGAGGVDHPGGGDRAGRRGHLHRQRLAVRGRHQMVGGSHHPRERVPGADRRVGEVDVGGAAGGGRHRDGERLAVRGPDRWSARRRARGELGEGAGGGVVELHRRVGGDEGERRTVRRPGRRGRAGQIELVEPVLGVDDPQHRRRVEAGDVGLDDGQPSPPGGQAGAVDDGGRLARRHLAAALRVGADGHGVEDLSGDGEAAGRGGELGEHHHGGVAPAGSGQHEEVPGRQQPGGAEAEGDRGGDRLPEGVGGPAADGEGVRGGGGQRAIRDDLELAEVERIADHLEAGHPRAERDGGGQRGRRHRPGEGEQEGGVAGHAGAVARGRRVEHRSRRAGAGPRGGRGS